MAATADVQQILEQDVPTAFRVPGCAMAVLKGGEVIAKHTWGYANLDTRAPVTPSTIFPICSISKQMVSLVLTELIRERGPEFANAVVKALHELLPASITSNKDFTVERLVGMQSGLRDYWVLSVLWGATPQDRFSIYQDAIPALKKLGNFHFAPGTQASYSNTNFLAIGLAIEKATGQSLGDLLEERLFAPTGMKTAGLRPDMARIPSTVVGYEGSEEMGYIPYSNRIEWAGDAGVSASLDDMIAYEKHIHRWSSDEKSAYYANAQEPKYIDNEPGNYGHGLRHVIFEGVKIVEHSGGLAGFKLRRSYVQALGLSIIILLNSETNSNNVMEYVLRKLTSTTVQSGPTTASSGGAPAKSNIEVKWPGNYFDEDTKLAVVVKQEKPGEIKVNCTGHDEKLRVQSESEAACREVQLRFENDELRIHRPIEHYHGTARRLMRTGGRADTTALVGEYHSEEIGSTFHVAGTGGMLYGAFDGYLGQGPMHVMRWLGENVWWLACFRSLDSPVPGYWTIAFQTGEDGKVVSGVTVSHWAARRVEYRKK